MTEYLVIDNYTKKVIGIKVSSSLLENTDTKTFIVKPANFTPEIGYTYSIDINNNIINDGVNTEYKIKTVENTIQNLLDKKAQEYGYDSILTVCSYAGYINDFQQEGVAFGIWRSSIWKYCYQELDKIQQGLRTEPTIEEFLLELPQLNLQG